MNQYEDSLKIQVERLEISSWLKSLSEQDSICPFCNGNHIGTSEELNTLCQAIKDIEKSAGDMRSIPAAFEREMQVVETEIEHCVEKLNAIRMRITEESGRKTDSSDKKYTLSGISRFLGRMEATFQTFERLGQDGELESKLEALSTRIKELSKIVNEADIRSKQESAIRYINQKLEKSCILSMLNIQRTQLSF